MTIVSSNLTRITIFSLISMVLSGCSTIDGEMNDPASMKNTSIAQEEQLELMADAPLAAPVPAVEQSGPTAAEVAALKDQALAVQGQRLAEVERVLTLMKNEASTMQLELEAARMDALDKQRMLDAQQGSSGGDQASQRMVAPDGGYGLHLASYELQESLAPGLRGLAARLPVLIEGRPIKLARVTVRGRNFMRLIIGQFDQQSDAAAECRQALMLVNYCEVVAFQGEDY